MRTTLTCPPHQGKLSSLPATFQALGVLLSYAVGLALNWHQLAWCSYRIIIIPILIITITFIVVYYFKSKKQSNWACIVLVHHHSNRHYDQDMHSSSHFVDLRSLLFARVSLTPRQVQIINDNIDDHDHEFTLELSGGQAMLITKTMIVSLRECNIDHWDTTELIMMTMMLQKMSRICRCQSLFQCRCHK